MKIIPLVFDRVFDVHQRASKTRTWTDFSFESAGKKFYGALVYGHPPLPIGAHLYVAVEEKTDLKTIYGWKHAATGEMVLQRDFWKPIALTVMLLAFLLATVPLFILNFHVTTMGVNIILALCLMGPCFVLWLAIRSSLRLERAYKLLLRHS